MVDAMNPETLPLLLVAILLATAGGAESVTLALGGDRPVAEFGDALVVADGTVTVPAAERVRGDLYVVGGSARVQGTVDGDVVQLDGNLTLGPNATVRGELQALGGRRTVASTASVDGLTVVDPVPREPSPVAGVGIVLTQAVVLGLAGFLLARRYPSLLGTVGTTVTAHPLVSGTVGTLVALTALALVVFMAFTLVLLPVSLLTLVAGLLTVGYGYVALGHVVGGRLPIDREPSATAAGAVVVVVTLAVLDWIPVVGALLAIGVTSVGLGATLLTYFGLQPFEPVSLPD